MVGTGFKNFIGMFCVQCQNYISKHTYYLLISAQIKASPTPHQISPVWKEFAVAKFLKQACLYILYAQTLNINSLKRNFSLYSTEDSYCWLTHLYMYIPSKKYIVHSPISMTRSWSCHHWSSSLLTVVLESFQSFCNINYMISIIHTVRAFITICIVTWISVPFPYVPKYNIWRKKIRKTTWRIEKQIPAKC